VSQLLADLGNSRLKWVVSGPQQWDLGSLLRGAQETGALLDEVWGAIPRPDKVVISSVASPETLEALRQWVAHHWAQIPHVVVSQPEQLGVRSRYTQPAALGSDRWAALIAARGLTSSPACIVDCGTALTVDALGADGVFLGGAIFPGLGLLRASLVRGTAAIGMMPGDDTSVQARSPADGVAAGTLIGLVGAIERLLDEQQKRLGQRMVVFLTGGDAPLLTPRLNRAAVEIPDLVLKGLARIAKTL